MIIGAFIYLAMRAMGELLLSNLRYKSFMDMAEDIIGRGRVFSSDGRTGSAGW